MIRAIALTIFAVSAFAVSTVYSQDFRVESKVFAGDAPEAVSQNTTLFYAGKIYDFLSNPAESTIYDLPRNRVILLSPTRGIQAEVTLDSLTDFSTKLQQWAASQSDPLLKFSAEPRFEQNIDDKANESTFSSQFVTYRVKTEKARSPEAARAYRQFCDLSGRLNGLTNPGALPPFPRMEINKALEASGVMPVKVHLNIASRRFGGKPLTAHSEHNVHWKLIDSDHQKIAEVNEYLTRLTKVSIQQYLQDDQQQAKR